MDLTHLRGEVCHRSLLLCFRRSVDSNGWDFRIGHNLEKSKLLASQAFYQRKANQPTVLPICRAALILPRVWHGGSSHEETVRPMAQLIPERLPNRVTASERRLFAALARLPADCLVYFEPVVANRYPDFVVIAPSLGVLTIELKGWRADDIVGADSRAVLLRDPSRVGGVDTVTRRTHPVRQARDYMFRLMDRCREHRYATCLLPSQRDTPGGLLLSFQPRRHSVQHHGG